MSLIIRILGPDDASVLERVAEDVFDNPVDPRWSAAFLADPRHIIAVAIEDDVVIGMATGVEYFHPDKPPELWVNEVGVAPTHHGRGIGKQVLGALLERGRERGCRQAWVLTSHDNTPARRLYNALGGVDSDESVLMIDFDLDRTLR